MSAEAAFSTIVEAFIKIFSSAGGAAYIVKNIEKRTCTYCGLALFA